MSNILLVPLHLDALVLQRDEMVIDAMADFSGLPFCNGREDINPDVANISEEIITNPFANKNLLLSPGIHLHWSLPDALTKARYTPGPNTQDFPRVPNRWLVTRCNAAGGVEREWIIESDFLYPPANKSSGDISAGVAIPYRSDERQPFRFMGRAIDIDAADRERGAYFRPLTAIGYGEPTFAAFYPNCHSVFGFFDHDYNGTNDGRQYYLTGWYSDAEQDVLLTHIYDALLLQLSDLVNSGRLAVKLRDAVDDLTKYLRAQFSADAQQRLREYTGPAPPSEALQKILVNELNRQLKGPSLYEPTRFAKVSLREETKSLLDTKPQGPELLRLNRMLLEDAFPAEILRSLSLTRILEDSFKWTFSLPERQDFPTRIVCYAKLVLGEPKVADTYDPPAIAVGNNGVEALSICMAQKLAANDSERIVEHQLQAMHLASRLEHLQVDVVPKFHEARHEEGFNAVPGGTLWTVRPESSNDSAAEASESAIDVKLPPQAGWLLNIVNTLQAKYDREQQKIESMRIQLFSDWYKYMLCAYPPPDARDSYPDIDLVADYVEQNVDALNDQLASTGTLIITEIGGRIIAESRAGAPASLADELAHAINELQLLVDTHVDALKGYRLKQTSGPRYWLPTEPAVALEGPLVKATARHGQDAQSSDGLMKTQFLAWVDPKDPSERSLRGLIRETIKGIGSGPDANFAFTTWQKQPWNPFLLEWQVEVFPVEHYSNIDPATGRYHEDFIVDNYQLKENDVDLSLKPDKGATTSAANIYTGRSILTPYAPAQLAQQIHSYLVKEILPLYYEEKRELESVNEDRWKVVHDWYEKRETCNASRHENVGLTAFDAWWAMQNVQSLSQCLGGFNEALLMHKQTMQLLVGDPLGFLDYQPFAETMRSAIDNSIYSAPEPLHDFNPIRTGVMKILQMRLVDTFGQVKPLDVTSIMRSEPLSGAVNGPLITLPPRLVQPARVNFRWLMAEAMHEEMNDHPATTPICGWFLANHLDNSLMIFDNSGKALGSLAKKASRSKPVWFPAPGGRGAATVDTISNPHLRKMVATIQDWGVEFFHEFLPAIDNALRNIEPENFAQHQDLAMLMGRPLALVRASVNLELKGLPATHQGWNEFRQDMKRDGRDDNGFSHVRFPIRVGEYRQFNDGTIGYLKEKGKAYEDEVFYAPQSDTTFSSPHLKTHKTGADAMLFYQSVVSDPQVLSLLIDPRGVVHATTGILPVKSISIPPEQYAAALEAIEVTVLSTPIVSDAGKIHVPLPDEPGYQWSWLQQNVGGDWFEISTRGLVLKEAFATFGSAIDTVWQQLDARRWIEINKMDPTRASVTAKDKRKDPPDIVKDKIALVEDILDRAHVGPVDLAANFSGRQEIREGWLKLSMPGDDNLKSQI